MASRTLIPFLAPTLFFFVTQPLLAAAGREPFAAVSQTNAGDREWAEEAAKILQIGARTLYRKLEKYQSGSPNENGE